MQHKHTTYHLHYLHDLHYLSHIQADALVNVAVWAEDPDIYLFSCAAVPHSVSGSKPRPRSQAPVACIAALTSGYLILLQPCSPSNGSSNSSSNRSSPSPNGALDVIAFRGQAALKGKWRLQQLAKINSSTKRPALLTLHWKQLDHLLPEKDLGAAKLLPSPSKTTLLVRKYQDFVAVVRLLIKTIKTNDLEEL
jgi:hypothetical protein